MHSLGRMSRAIMAASLSMYVALSGCSQQDEAAPLEVSEDAQGAAQWVDEEEGVCNARIRPSVRCADPLAPGDERMCRLGLRSYTVRAGKTMDPCTAVPVIIDLHGALQTPAQALGEETFCLGTICWSGLGSGWVAESDTPDGGFIVVAPQGGTDSDFLADLVNELSRVAKVDINRVYVSGLDDGAERAAQAICDNARVFRGGSANAGGASCWRVAKPTPFISFAATTDLAYPETRGAAESMARANGCRRGPSSWRTFNNRTLDAVCRSGRSDPRARLIPCSQVTAGRVEPTTCKVWDQCDGNVEVVHCDVAPGSEHGLLNGPADAHMIYNNDTFLNTPSVAWRFFKQFR